MVHRDRYQEGATATVSVYDRQRKRLGTVYLGHMPEAGQGTLSELLTRVLTDVLARWDGATPRLDLSGGSSRSRGLPATPWT